MKTNIETLIQNVREWGQSKGITGPNAKATILTQLEKTQEKLTETRDAAVLWKSGYSHTIKKGKVVDTRDEIKDGIGDCAVTLILAAELADLDFIECLQAAYNEIKGRAGKMIDGVFVKDQ